MPADDAHARSSIITGENPFAATLAAQGSTESSPAAQTAAPITTSTDLASPAGSAAQVVPPAPVRNDAGTAVTLTIAAPMTAPDFAPALAVQVSVLARDGVQHAELHLNPAEMGPVSVQIVMDGTQARVDFGADIAATRQAIEAGLPELASALREAGFTLAGGGVSQHSRGRGGNGDASGRHPHRMLDDASVARIDDAVRVAPRTVRLGGLDLYA